MKSTIKIALGQNNEPVINMIAISTDDIRDQLCRQWIERLGGESNLAYARFGIQEMNKDGEHSCQLEISPLGPKSHLLNHGLITDIYNHFSKGTTWFSMLTSGEHIWFENSLTNKSSDKLDREHLRTLSIVELVQTVIDNINTVSSLAEKPVDNKLPSRYQVDDSISTEEVFDGQIVGIRFTIGKVYYDVLDKLSGKVVRDVDSCDITQDTSSTIAAVTSKFVP